MNLGFEMFLKEAHLLLKKNIILRCYAQGPLISHL